MPLHIFYRFLFFLLINSQISSTEAQFRLYHTDRVSNIELYYDCLLYKEGKKASPFGYLQIINSLYEIIPFCIRPPDLYYDTFPNKQTCKIHGTSIKFETLQSENVTSEQLYNSYAPIDVVERYQAFLESSNQSLSTQLFCNCSIPWFGEFCQYTLNVTRPLYEIVPNYLQDIAFSLENGTCYTFMKCDRGPPPSCLDWREICDGKIDCLDSGIDELVCDELDSNECTKDEFRCRNGLCVPNDFFNDDPYHPDCIDRSDEKIVLNLGPLEHYECYLKPDFGCEETMCRNERKLSCGDGQCAFTSCTSNRDKILWRAKLSWNANLHLSFECWTNLICSTVSNHDRTKFFDSMNCAENDGSERLIREKCPTLFVFPAHPIILGHIRFAYATNLKNKYDWYGLLLPDFVCYDQQLCQSLPCTVWVNDSSCRSLSELNLDEQIYDQTTIESRTLELFLKCSTTNNSYIQCPKSKPYRCVNSSKCLALNRLLDGFSDCFEGDDEEITDSCSLPDKHYRFKCSSENKCITLSGLENGRITCIGGEEIERDNLGYVVKSYSLSFQILCDGFVEHTRIDGLNYTDEMDCEHWPCNNVYTRCDDLGTWNCPDGVDEANCSSNPCGPDKHPCVLPHSYNFTCLPLSRINDGHIDCLGSYDERNHCLDGLLYTASPNLFPVYRCLNERKCLRLYSVCDSQGNKDCEAGDDEGEWCSKSLDPSPRFPNVTASSISSIFDRASYLFHLQSNVKKSRAVFFKLVNHLIYPTPINTIASVDFNPFIPAKIDHSDESTYNSNQPWVDSGLRWLCYRGIPIASSGSRKKSCLCPPAYFGYQCEYQSQRVSLTLQIRTIEWQTVHTLVMMLIDDDTNINSYDQIDYLSVRDCGKKFNIYLLYSTQPKYHNRTYYVRIDVYDKMKLKYYVSMIYPIRFSSLPVHRLSLQVNIPIRESFHTPKNCLMKCFFGQCTRFVNLDKFFCRCFDGYSGKLCTIKNDCHCSSNSICVGTINNRSICVCPLNKFGPRCYLRKTICMSNPCHNGSQCVATEEKLSASEYFCICSESSMNLKCDNTEMKIEFLFAKNILIPQSIIIHFINVTEPHFTYESPTDPTQTTMISKIGFDQTSTVVYYRQIFHLIIVEFNQDYYLALLRDNYTSFVNISTRIIPEYRCLPISQLFDIQIQTLPRWHRAKHYHIPCQKRPDLACFYDNDQFMCLCNIDRHANCFKFNFRRVYNCFGYNYCENGGYCYQNNNNCPTSSSCFCTECYYGRLCQFNSAGFGLTLDGILGYSIWPNVPFSRQPIVVHVSTALTVIMFVIAIIISVLSIITFRTKRSLGVGCGFYLLASSITSCLTMIIFTLKFLLLILSQMSIITNSSFLLFNCIIMDMLLKVFVSIGDWLNACVAIERTLTIKKGIKFNKTKSKKMAKWIICIICLVTLSSYIHDPIHRHLLEDKQEQRRWCVVRYSSSVQAFASFINIVHFLVPLSINLISALFVILLMARQKSTVCVDLTHRQQLWKQFHEHKHLLISSFVLIIVATPRLLISFVSGCMKSARNPWLYLVAYFISFVPPLLVFIIFVLPSKFYRKEFNDATILIKKNIQRRFHSQ